MSVFLKRLGERVLVAFLGGAMAVMVENGFELDKAALGAAVAAGVHAVYGLLVKGVGDSDRPDAAK